MGTRRAMSTSLFLLGLAAAAIVVAAGSWGEAPASGARVVSGGPAAVARNAAPEEAGLVALDAAAVPLDPAAVRALRAELRAAGVEDASRPEVLARHAADPLVAGNALRAMGRLGMATADRALGELVDDARPRVRQEAIVACGESGDRRHVPRLLQVLHGADEVERALAIRALGRLGGPEAARALFEVERDPEQSETARVFACEALLHLHPGPGDGITRVSAGDGTEVRSSR